MKNLPLLNSIENCLNSIILHIDERQDKFSIDSWKKIKSQLSTSGLASRLCISEAMYQEFEQALIQFDFHKDDFERSKLSCLRVSLWLETVTAKMGLPFEIEIEKAISTEEVAIKQVRAMELIIRDVITDQLGGKESVLSKLQQLFKQDVLDKWIKSADETGILSGTTFSELSNIFLDKNIFKSVEEIFKSSNIQLTKSARDSVRYILDDIRVIRNSIAHNKRISTIQIEALNEYYKVLADIIKNAPAIKVDPDRYLDLSKANMEAFLSNMKEDQAMITGSIDEIKSGLSDIKTDTTILKKESGVNKKRTLAILSGVVVIILLTCGTLYFQHKQSESSSSMGQDIKEVKEIVKGDGELKNMSSSEDLSVTQDLNKRTKNVNAQRLAILYFDNSGGEPSMNKLKKGLADMLITDLSNIEMLDIVERDKLEAILNEQKLSSTKEFDPSTAAKVGKLLGAQIILTGGYFDMMGSLRIDARFIDVETGKILKSDGVDGQLSSFFKIQKQLSWKIIKDMDTKLTDEEDKALKNTASGKSISYQDMNLYSEALDLYDTGKKENAKKIFSQLISKYPDFIAAKNAVAKIK